MTCCAVAALCAPGARAEGPGESALNGTYQAVSNGNWAKSNGVYRDQPTTVSIWTIESTCTDVQTCTGRVTSDHGWSADLQLQTQTWRLRRELGDWQPCPDGSVGPGHQLYRFYPYSGDALVGGYPVLAGEDMTTGEPGACGVGYPLETRMPFRLTKLS